MVEIFDNIRKIYKFSTPSELLADYIEFFSETSFDDTARLILTEHFNVKMFQSWTPTFWFNLGTTYNLEFGGKLHYVSSKDDLLILRNATVTRHVLKTDHIFTVKFFPGGLEAILGINQSKLINKIINLNHIIPQHIIKSIKKKSSFEERVSLLQNYFVQNYEKNKKGDYYLKFVRDITDKYQNENLQLNTSQIAEKMFITSKTINRYFNNIVGISPKKYFSIVRARTALVAYVASKKEFTPNYFGFYDMSHFYKEVTSFTGQSLLRNV